MHPKPLIAAVNGAAIGVGVTMILPFDVRIASEEAKLGLAFVKLGILPGLGSTHLLPRLVGRAKALELVLSARTIPAREALAIGLVNAVVPGEKLLASARELATAVAAHRPEGVAAAKAAVNFGAEHGTVRQRTNSGASRSPSAVWWRRCQAAPRASCSASITASGFFAAIRSKASAGPSGVRRPCSQLRKVATLTPIMSANSLCEAPSLARTAFTSVGRKAVILPAFIRPLRMRPACRTLATSS